MLDTMNITIKKTENSRLPEVDFNDVGFGKIYSDHMFVADYVDGKWTDLRIVPYGDLTLSPANSALHYGQSIFEGLKAYRNQNDEVVLFRPDRNFERMNKSAERMMMAQMPKEVFMDGLTALLDVDRGWVPKMPDSLYIRPFMFAMDPYIGVRPSESYRFMIFTTPVGAYYSEPVKVKVETHFTRAAVGGTGFAKTAGNYAASLYPASLAQKEGYHQLVWTDGKTHEYIEESGTMNIFFVVDDTVLTAPTGDTILDGVTRGSVLQLLRSWGMKVEERPIKVAEIIEAAAQGRLKEAFGAGTAATIAHVSQIAHEGKNYDLPAVEDRKISPRVLDTLNKIKTGEENDEFGWIMKV